MAGVPVEPLTLVDGEVWIYDPDFLDPGNGEAPDGVLAVMNRKGAVQVLIKTGPIRQWVNVEQSCATTVGRVS